MGCTTGFAATAIFYRFSFNARIRFKTGNYLTGYFALNEFLDRCQQFIFIDTNQRYRIPF